MNEKLNNIKIIESAHCTKPFELNEFTKELMSDKWLKQFHEWAKYALPEQPACYMSHGNVLIAHPLIVNELRKQYAIK